MKKILADAANIGAVSARAIAYRMRDRDGYFYPDSNWRLPFFGGYEFEVGPGVSNLDGAAFFYYLATGVTPAMAEKMVGEGSQYPWTALDGDGEPFDGAKTYKLRLPANVPVKDFWSVILYDTQTRSMLQTDQRFPSVSSQDAALKRTPTVRSTSGSAPRRPRGWRTTGCRPSPERAGSRSCGCTDRSSRGSTRPGGPARSNSRRTRAKTDQTEAV